MMKTHVRKSLVALALLGVAMLTLAAQAGTISYDPAHTILYDDFSDPEASAAIWTPVENRPGSFEVLPGEGFVLTPTVDSVVLRAGSISLRQVSVGAFAIGAGDVGIRTRVRKIQTEPGGEGGAIGLWWRGSPPDPAATAFSFYYAFVKPDGAIFMGRSDGAGVSKRVAFDVSQRDVMMQLEAIGNTANFWVWPADEQMPAAPQLTAVDDTYHSGTVGLWANGGPVDGLNEFSQSVFRFVHVAVPEPSSFLLAAVGAVTLLAAACWRRRKRAAQSVNGGSRFISLKRGSS